jgi:hypothetical protein
VPYVLSLRLQKHVVFNNQKLIVFQPYGNVLFEEVATQLPILFDELRTFQLQFHQLLHRLSMAGYLFELRNGVVSEILFETIRRDHQTCIFLFILLSVALKQCPCEGGLAAGRRSKHYY